MWCPEKKSTVPQLKGEEETDIFHHLIMFRNRERPPFFSRSKDISKQNKYMCTNGGDINHTVWFRMGGGGSFQKQKLNAVMMVSSFMMFILLFPPPPCIELCKIASALSRRVCSSALYKCLCFTENQLQVSAASMITH